MTTAAVCIVLIVLAAALVGRKNAKAVRALTAPPVFIPVQPGPVRTPPAPVPEPEPDLMPVILPTLKELEKEERDRQKAVREAEERQLAESDIDRWEGLKTTYIRLLEAIDSELETTTDPKRITTLLTRQANTEAKVHNLDRRIEKATLVARRAA